MYSNGVSVWFACKLCKSYFVQADDFVYHKRKSHRDEFQNMKYIVFEERDIPKHNWVSLLPTTTETEATQAHQNIPSLPPPTSTNNVNSNASASDEIIKSKQNIPIPQISKKYSNDRTDKNILNSCIDLNPNIQASSVVDVDTEENDPLQSDISLTMPTKTDKQKIRNVISNNTCQTVSQSTHTKPYVYLKRLNLKCTQNLAACQSNRPMNLVVENEESNKNNNNANHPSSANQLKVTTAAEAQELFKRIITSNPPAKFPPLTTTSVDCKFCCKTFNSTPEFDTHEDICRLKRQFNNILCVSCLLTFSSSDELNEHNCKFHSTSMSTSDYVRETQADDGSQVEVATKLLALSNNNPYEDISSNTPDFNPDAQYLDLNLESNTDSICGDADLWEEEFVSHDDPLSTSTSILVDDEIAKPTSTFSSSSLSVLYKCKFCSKKIKSDIFQTHVKICKNLSSSQNEQSEIAFKDDMIATPILGDSFNYAGNFVKVLKTEFAETETHGNDDSEFLLGVDRDRDPFQSIASVEPLSEETLNVAVSSSAISEEGELPPKETVLRMYCGPCKINFPTVREYISHTHKFHRLQNVNLVCSFPNCGRISTSSGNLKKHVMQVHSNARPFKCPYPNCTGLFKSSSTRNRHFKTVHHKASKSSLPTTTTTALRIASTASQIAPKNQKKLSRTVKPKTVVVVSYLNNSDEKGETVLS